MPKGGSHSRWDLPVSRRPRERHFSPVLRDATNDAPAVEGARGAGNKGLLGIERGRVQK